MFGLESEKLSCVHEIEAFFINFSFKMNFKKPKQFFVMA